MDLNSWKVFNSWEEIDINENNENNEELPILIINLNKLCKLDKYSDINEDNIDFRLRGLISANCSEICEELFINNICYHSTTFKYNELLTDLNTNDKLIVFHYPEIIGDDELIDIWKKINKQTKWKSVNYIKEITSECNRDLIWKVKMSENIEKIAINEAKELLKKLSDNINKLNKLKEDRIFLRDEISHLKFLKESIY